MRAAILASVASILPSSALACPDCVTARAARASVYGDGFFLQLATLVLPLLVIGAVSALLYRIGEPQP